MYKVFVKIIICIFFSSCASNINSKLDLYKKAELLENEQQYLEAAKIFDQIIDNAESSGISDDKLWVSYLTAGHNYRKANFPKNFEKYIL